MVTHFNLRNKLISEVNMKCKGSEIHILEIYGVAINALIRFHYLICHYSELNSIKS